MADAKKLRNWPYRGATRAAITTDSHHGRHHQHHHIRINGVFYNRSGMDGWMVGMARPVVKVFLSRGLYASSEFWMNIKYNV